MSSVTKLTNEDLLIDPEMIDTDNLQTAEQQFKANANLKEGVSGRKTIDTMYENTSQAVIDNPREGSTPAPVCLNSGMFPHRRM
jgi:hypothetical protein